MIKFPLQDISTANTAADLVGRVKDLVRVVNHLDEVLLAGNNVTIVSDKDTRKLTISSSGSGGGGGGNGYGTVEVAGQANLVAQSTNAIVTFVAGAGMVLTTNVASDGALHLAVDANNFSVNSAVFSTNALFANTANQANNTTLVNGKTEGNLNVNNASFAGAALTALVAGFANTANQANNTTLVNGKTEGNLNVNNATFSTNASFANTANQANNTTLVNGKTEGNLNVNTSSILANSTVAGLVSTTTQTLAGDKTLLGNTSANNLVVSGITTLTGNVTASGFVNVAGNLVVSGLTTLTGNATLSGFANIATTLNVAGISTLTGNVSAGGFVNVAGTLQVAGLTTLTGNATLSGFANIAQNLTVAGIAQLTGNVTMSGFANIAQTLQVAGLTTLTGNATLSGFANIAGALVVAGLTTLTGNATLSGFANIAGKLVVAGNSTLTSNAVVGANTLFVDTSTNAVGVNCHPGAYALDVNGTLNFSGVLSSNGVALSTSLFYKLDSISGSFNGSQTVFNLLVSSVAIGPGTAQNLLISLNGVIQNPGVDYTISASTITFTTAPASTDTFFGVAFANLLYNSIIDFEVAQGRLTVTSGTPVTTAEPQSNTVYWTPYGGSRIGLYDGVSTWTIFKFSETALALGTLTSGLPYDVFAYNNAGTLALTSLAWTSNTARATALTTQDGILVKTGNTQQRYLGTFYTISTTQTEDSATKRFLWNYYNRVERPMRRLEGTISWNYTTAAFQQANANTLNQLAVVVGFSEDAIDVSVAGDCLGNGAIISVAVGIGYDSTTAAATGCIMQRGITGNTSAGTLVWEFPSAELLHIPDVGYHKYVWLEYSTASGTTQWGGTDGVSYIQNGITGMWKS